MMGYPQRTRGTTARTQPGGVRVRLGGDQLGVLPLVAAAVPSVGQITSKILSGVVSIFDPGKKRDANREARAEMWYQFASAGSITAARRLYGGQQFQYTDKEKGYYRDRWSKFQSALPDLAKQATQLGPLGIPEPGSGVEPPQLSPADQQAIQAEIDAYHAAHAQQGTTPPAQPPVRVAQAGIGTGFMDNPLVLGGALIAAFLFNRSPKRRR